MSLLETTNQTNQSLNNGLNNFGLDARPIWEDPKFLFPTTCIWVLISVVGILANVCVISVTLCSSTKKSATQYFITNLAFSDMLFLLISPTLALFNLHGVISYGKMSHLMGKIVCKADYYLSHLTVFITCLTLMSMTFDRYIAIMYPLKALLFRSTTKAIYINLAIWIVSIILCIPPGYFRVVIHDPDSALVFCGNAQSIFDSAIDFEFLKLNFSQLNLLYIIVISYLIPFVVILVCFLIMMNKLTMEKPLFRGMNRAKISESQKKRRVLIMIALVTTLFGVCWLPIHGFHFALRFFSKSFPYESRSLFVFKTAAHTLTYLNSMLNPFFYTIMGNNFRKQVFSHKLKFSSSNSCRSRTIGGISRENFTDSRSLVRSKTLISRNLDEIK